MGWRKLLFEAKCAALYLCGNARLAIQAYKHQSDPNAILIHQMGKVGSTSVYKTLCRKWPNKRIFHTHFLNSDRIARFIDKEPMGKSHRYVIEREWILRHLDRFQSIYIITLVRDPVARNISAYFQNHKFFFPEDDFDVWEDKIDVLRERFFCEYPHEVPLTWLDDEINKVFGIDIYAQPFPHNQGFVLIEKDNFRLLVVRVEDLTRVGSQALTVLFGCNIVMLEVGNVGENKGYSLLYKKFLDGLCLSNDYLKQMYCSKYATHFYTEEERKAFLDQWRRP